MENEQSKNIVESSLMKHNMKILEDFIKEDGTIRLTPEGLKVPQGTITDTADIERAMAKTYFTIGYQIAVDQLAKALTTEGDLLITFLAHDFELNQLRIELKSKYE